MKKVSTKNVIRFNISNGNYTTINNQIIHDKNLSVTDKMVLISIISQPIDFIPYNKQLEGLLGVSEDSITKSLKSLELNGYLIKKKRSNGRGNGFCYDWLISENGDLRADKIQVDKEYPNDNSFQPELDIEEIEYNYTPTIRNPLEGSYVPKENDIIIEEAQICRTTEFNRIIMNNTPRVMVHIKQSNGFISNREAKYIYIEEYSIYVSEETYLRY